MIVSLEDVTAAVRGWRYSYTAELQLQDGLEAALVQAGLPVEREVDLGAGHGRIDLMCDRIGIEVKVASSAAIVLRQLTRYAASGRLDGLVLVTSRVRHAMPSQLGAVPLVVVSTVMAGL